MLNKLQEADSKKCDEMDEQGKTKECMGCSCSVCIAQESNFSISDLVKEAHQNAKSHGFWEDYSPAHEKQFINNAIGNRLMLITTEVAEAEDGLRKNDFENFKEELADIIIRTCDLAGGLNIDLEAEIIKKMEKNKSREYKHGKLF